jgi:hypothetical protein
VPAAWAEADSSGPSSCRLSSGRTAQKPRRPARICLSHSPPPGHKRETLAVSVRELEATAELLERRRGGLDASIFREVALGVAERLRPKPGALPPAAKRHEPKRRCVRADRRC